MVETFCYINENIPSKTVNAEDIEDDCKIVLIEFSIKTCKWLYIQTLCWMVISTKLLRPTARDDSIDLLLKIVSYTHIVCCSWFVIFC